MTQGSGDGAFAYRAHLDGLRAVAVYLVVLFHAGIDRFPGGFVGVDIFFVLSGYLVTNLLLQDLRGPTGRVGLGRFYARRVRRLLPAAAVNLVVTAIVFSAVAAPVELDDARAGIRAASLYIANWHFLAQAGDYFAADVNANPVVHYWSLSVEEQFYLAWPLLLGALWAMSRRAGRHHLVALRLTIGSAMVGSLAAALLLSDTSLDRAYYGTDTRAYQLLAGAGVALSPRIVQRLDRTRGTWALGGLSLALVAGLVVAGSSAVGLGPIQRGAVVTALTCAVIIVLESAPAGLGRRALSGATVTYLGKISYGTYLWHWLVIVVLDRRAELSSGATAFITIVVATGIASLSHQLLELPIRSAPRLDRRRLAVVVTGLTASATVGLVAVPWVLDRSSGEAPVRPASEAAVGLAVPDQATIEAARLDQHFIPSSCEVSGPVACPVATGPGGSAIVVGESHAAMLTPVLAAVTERHGMSLYAGYLSYCPWTWGLAYSNAGPNCLADQDDLFERIIPELDPDIVFLAHRAVDDRNNPLDLRDERGRYAGRSPEQAEALDASISRLVSRLRSEGRVVVMFEPIPVVSQEDDPLTCLSGARYVEECRFVTSRAPGAEERVMRRLAAEDGGVLSVDLDSLACPYLPICDPIVGGAIVRVDGNHLTQSFARTLIDPIDQYLTSQGAFAETG